MLPQVASAHRAFDKALQQISDDAAKKNAATEGRGSRRCSIYQKKKSILRVRCCGAMQCSYTACPSVMNACSVDSGVSILRLGRRV